MIMQELLSILDYIELGFQSTNNLSGKYFCQNSFTVYNRLKILLLLGIGASTLKKLFDLQHKNFTDSANCCIF